jgi:hypothetical protein
MSWLREFRTLWRNPHAEGLAQTSQASAYRRLEACDMGRGLSARRVPRCEPQTDVSGIRD